MVHTGWIIYNGSLQSKAFYEMANMLKQACDRQSLQTKIFRNNDLLTMFHGNSLSLLNYSPIDLPKFAIFLDKDIHLARQLELLGIRVFNRPQAILDSDNKITTYQLLAKNHIPIPKTIVAPKQYPYQPRESDHFSFIDNVMQELQFPMVIKEAFGSFGEQVYLIQSEEELIHKINALYGKEYLFQALVTTSYGRDIRCQVVGDEVVAAMIRSSESDFRSNVTAGGKMTPYEPSRGEKNLAIAATKAIGADFAGVDILFGPNDTRIVCEVNSNAHIKNLYDCTNINAADHIITYIKNIMGKEM